MNKRNSFLVRISAIALMLTAYVSCSDDDSAPPPPPGSMEPVIRIEQVDAVNNKIVIKNFGTGAKDIGDYWICNLMQYAQLNSLTSGNLNLGPNQSITLDREINDVASSIGLYNAEDFENADAMEDFMQYGQDVGSSGRVDVAVAKGIWGADEFVEGVSPYIYTGTGTQTGSNFWSGATPPEPANVRILAVDAEEDMITLKNFGGTALDISGFWICNLKNYAQVNGLTGEDLILDPNETIVLDREISDDASDVGLYITDTFDEASAMIDFVQVGGDVGANGNADLAAAQGLWTVGEFVEGTSPYEYTGDGTQNGADFWTGVAIPVTPANVRLYSVDAVNNTITLKNYGGTAKEIGNYWICNRMNYGRISTLTDDDLNLGANQTITLDRVINDSASSIALYDADNFTSANAMVDFMQYGEDVGGSGRVDVAVTKGIWSAGDFVGGGSPYQYNGTGVENGVGNWSGN